jgi:hypothetical protein
MKTALELTAWLGGMAVPFGLAGWAMFHSARVDPVPDDPHAADAAFEAEKLADARLQPFNGGAR